MILREDSGGGAHANSGILLDTAARRHQDGGFGRRVSTKLPVILTLHNPSVALPLLLYAPSFISFGLILCLRCN